jgi:CRISPR-associated protein Cmr2
MRYLLAVSLGPVQDFIASARRCRDLWFGSWLLSELSKAVAAGIVDALEDPPEEALRALVFPYVAVRADLDPGSGISIANKIIARVSGDANHVREVAQKGREAMEARLRTLREHIFQRVGATDPRREAHFHEERAIAQIDSLIDCAWVAVIEDEGPDGYARARVEAERLLGARKHTQSFKQPSWATAGVPKSSLDGVRESVLDEAIFDRPITGHQRDTSLTPEQRLDGYGVGGSERLCGVGLLKRRGAVLDSAGGIRAERFFSTSHVAALPFMIGADRLEEQIPGLKTAWETLCNAVGGALPRFNMVSTAKTKLFGTIDGAILFPPSLDETLEECGLLATREHAQRALNDVVRLTGLGEPSPYYAILVADGDRMGTIIGHQKDVESHRALAQALSAFAQEAKRIVEDEHTGSLIYSGGDDVLALLPLHSALECASALSRRFAELLGSWRADDGSTPTLSVGLGISHAIEPMGAALTVARSAEAIAKELPGKDAIAIVVNKRSGNPIEVCGHWGSLIPRLRDLIGLYQADAIPDKAGYELSELSHLTRDAEPEALASLREIQKSEALRILRRKRARRGKEDLAAKTLEKLAAHLGEDPAVLARELYVAKLLSQAQTLVRGGKESS